MSTAEALHSAGSAEWYTPPSVIEPARAVLGGIDLDPASCRVAQTIVQARRLFTAQDDGLTKDWVPSTDSVWLNPPTPPAAWWVRLMHECDQGRRAVYLAYSAEQVQQSQVWARREGVPSMFDRRHSICSPSTRITFLRRAGDALAARLAQRKKLLKAGTAVPKALAHEIETLRNTSADSLVRGDQPAHSSFIIGINVDRADFRRAFKSLGDCR
jgi:hypothetical protein